MVFNPYEAATNWFLTWDEETADAGKSFLLQVKLTNLTFRDVLSDGANSYVTVSRQREGPGSGWEVVGRTSVIKDEAHPEYPEGFRIFYEQETNLSEDMLKVICYHKRDVLGHEEVIGTASISVLELVRAFGTRVQVELVKQKKDIVVGAVWFLGEPLPGQSPRGGANVFEFKMSTMAPRKSEVKFHAARIFLVLSRERDDKTWGVAYRSAVVKRHPIVNLINRRLPITLEPFQVRQSELVLGQRATRKVKFSLFHKGRRGEPHVNVGDVVTSADELLNEFPEDTSLDVILEGQIIGELANISRQEKGKLTTFELELNYFDAENEAREIQERRRNKVLNLDSP